MGAMQSLSFSESSCVSPKHIERANRAIWGIPEVILPYPPPSSDAVLDIIDRLLHFNDFTA